MGLLTLAKSANGLAGADWPMIGKGLASCPQCSPMAQGGLVLMAGMVALVITQSDKGGHQGEGLALIYWAVCSNT